MKISMNPLAARLTTIRMMTPRLRYGERVIRVAKMEAHMPLGRNRYYMVSCGMENCRTAIEIKRRDCNPKEVIYLSIDFGEECGHLHIAGLK